MSQHLPSFSPGLLVGVVSPISASRLGSRHTGLARTLILWPDGEGGSEIQTVCSSSRTPWEGWEAMVRELPGGDEDQGRSSIDPSCLQIVRAQSVLWYQGG